MDDHTGAVLEHIEDQLKTILEGQAAMASVPSDIAELKSDVQELKTDMKATKAAITDLSRELRTDRNQLNDHDIRITAIEQAA